VVYATGAMRDRRPWASHGEDLPGQASAATDFRQTGTAAHPDVDPGAFTLDAAEVGRGHRRWQRGPWTWPGSWPGTRDELRHTGRWSQPVLDALTASKVREVHMIGRRGPAQAKFTHQGKLR